MGYERDMWIDDVCFLDASLTKSSSLSSLPSKLDIKSREQIELALDINDSPLPDMVRHGRLSS